MRRTCQIFYCDAFGERLCCADCPSPCANRCLNGPERCGLVDTSTHASKKNGRFRAPRAGLDDVQKAELRKKLAEGVPQNRVAKLFGVSPSTVYYYARRMREEAVSDG